MAMLAAPVRAAAPDDAFLAVTLARAPYLQQVTDHSALVVWRTATAAACTLAYAPSGGPTSKVVTSPATEHVVALNGLQAATRYDYSIRSAGLLAGGSDTTSDRAVARQRHVVRWRLGRFRHRHCRPDGSCSRALTAQVADLEAARRRYHLERRVAYYNALLHAYAAMLRHMPVWAIPATTRWQRNPFLDAGTCRRIR
jgi:hypothetical protein